MPVTTNQQFDEIVLHSKEVFLNKAKDYGTSWRILRLSSVTDQIMIKAKRIRNIDEKKEKKIKEDIDMEFIGIINYSIIALIQLELKDDNKLDLSTEELEVLYNKQVTEIKKLMKDKNHDYGEAWRDLRVTSMNDLILMKILRIKQIENNRGETIVSEGVAANYQDIVNYAIFALIKLKEQHEDIG